MPVVGRPVAVTVVAEVDPDSQRFAEPTPVVPSDKKYEVTPVPAVQVNLIEVLLKVLPGAGEVSAAGACVASLNV
jgi:hypothetical protein